LPASQSVTACGAPADLPAVLKWPNDVLIADRKVCGILSERVDTSQGPACVVGIGINVSLEEDQLPVPSATSLAIAAGRFGVPSPSRTAVIATVLAAFDLLYGRWEGPAWQRRLAGSLIRRALRHHWSSCSRASE
jgi:BirA family biotin operon repressor/biotin-[acetyl-CoA-carboxylase] ligase